jgi:hypothetical protein
MRVDCELLENKTTGEELALKIPKAYRKRQVTGVLANCTNCEPAMCKMGRMVMADLGHDWFGCTDHRLEKTTGAFYKHKGVVACVAKEKEIVTLIHTSSQVVRPVKCCVCMFMFVLASVGECMVVYVWCTLGSDLVFCQFDTVNRTEQYSSRPNSS